MTKIKFPFIIFTLIQILPVYIMIETREENKDQDF